VCVGPPRTISGGPAFCENVPLHHWTHASARVWLPILQLLLYHSGCQGVKRATTTYRRNIGAYWTRATFFSAPGIWQRYVIIRRSTLPRYLWDREREIERNRNRARAVPFADLSSRKCTAYLRNRNRFSTQAAALSTCLWLTFINIVRTKSLWKRFIKLKRSLFIQSLKIRQH